MMIGMMAPSVAPMILTYARVGREGNVEGKPLAATGWFAAGYFLTWIGFALAGSAGSMTVRTSADRRPKAGLVLLKIPMIFSSEGSMRFC